MPNERDLRFDLMGLISLCRGRVQCPSTPFRPVTLVRREERLSLA